MTVAGSHRDDVLHRAQGFRHFSGLCTPNLEIQITLQFVTGQRAFRQQWLTGGPHPLRPGLLLAGTGIPEGHTGVHDAVVYTDLDVGIELIQGQPGGRVLQGADDFRYPL